MFKQYKILCLLYEHVLLYACLCVFPSERQMLATNHKVLVQNVMVLIFVHNIQLAFQAFNLLIDAY